jgi:sialate O-acetylesterase
MKTNFLKSLSFLLFSNLIFANITLPNIFADNMVLQRNSEVTIWGWGSPNEEIKLKPSWNTEIYTVKVNNIANWQIKIKTPEAGGPYTILINGFNEIKLNNILIGEVWICSGQSNMEMTAAWGIENGDQEVKDAFNPNIRFFNIPKLSAITPQNNLSGNWVECTSESMKNFSATAYFFGRHLQGNLKNVPVGLISSNWGATPAEVWMPENVIQNNEELLIASTKINQNEYCPVEPARTFNAMIHPLIGFKIAGVLWYQGESNVGSSVYEKTFSTLIRSWRELWNDEFPFYYVQIAPYKYGENHFGGAIIRDAQRKVQQQISNTGMVMTSDISTIDDIHPKNKKSVGIRLANLALTNTYYTNTDIVNGPLYKNIKIEKNKIFVYFDYSQGLYFSDKKSSQFEIAGVDNVYYEANALIRNNSVILKSEKVKHPVKVRFSWKNTAQSNLFNKSNLPASSFITE